MRTTSFIMLLSAMPGAAQPALSDKLSLPAAIAQALKNNKALEAASAYQEAVGERLGQARAGLLPKVNYSESWTRSDNPVFVFSSLLTQRQFGPGNFQVDRLTRPGFLNNFQSMVTVDQPLFDAGRTRRAVASAELGRETASEEKRRTEMQVIARVASAYWNAVLSAERLAVARSAVRAAQAALEQAQARHQAGMTTEADVLSVRVHLASADEEQIRREADVGVASAQLNDAIGLPLDTRQSLPASLMALPAPAEANGNEASVMQQRPELRLLRIGMRLAESQAAEARSALLPQVSLRGAYEVDRQRLVSRVGDNWLISVGLRWNLFNGFGDQARIREAQALIRRQVAEQQAAESAVRLEVRSAYAELQASTRRIEVSRAAVGEAEESRRVSLARYGAGLSTITDVLRAETAVVESATRHLVAIRDQRVAAVTLALASGSLDADSEVLR